jgi:NhaP-type Na+/H+ or K+/H+ antiporter
MLRALHHDIVLDLFVSVLVLAIHFGTFSGVMAATIAGLLMSVATSSMKKAVGHIQGDTYFPGFICLKV